MEFVVDSMLGDIARWLRMLGHDTLYSSEFEDWRIIKIAEKDGRIIVTRDRGLFMRARKKGLKALLVELGRIEEQIAEIAIRTGIELSFDPNKTRCPYCNTRLVKLSKAEALSLLPSKIVSTYDDFWKCPKCGRIYWQGSHWRTINKVLKKANVITRSRGSGNELRRS